MKKLVRLLALGAVVAAVVAWLQRRPAPPSASPTAPPTPAPRPDPAPAPVVPTEGMAPLDESPGADGWVEAGDDGTCPDGYPVKAKDASKIFHVPGGVLYDRTVPDRCYPSPSAAEADGYRQSLR